MEFYDGNVCALDEIKLTAHERRLLSESFSLFRAEGGGRDADEVLRSFEDSESFRACCMQLAKRFRDRLENWGVESKQGELHSLVGEHHALKNQSFKKYAPGGAHRDEFGMELPNGKFLEVSGERNDELYFKLCGAGGTGHLLVSVNRSNHSRISHVMEDAWGPELPFRFVEHGTQVIYTE
jgi:hypothetical protein